MKTNFNENIMFRSRRNSFYVHVEIKHVGVAKPFDIVEEEIISWNNTARL